MVNWDLWYRLGTPSRRAIRRSHTRSGRPYDYRPRGNLLDRLSQESGQTKQEIYEALTKMHQYFKSNRM